MKRSDIPVVDVLRAHRDYRAEMDAALAARGAQGSVQAVVAILESDFPRPARPVERLMAAGFPYKVAMARIMQLDGQGLLEYGVSPTLAWLTDAGRARLAELEVAS